MMDGITFTEAEWAVNFETEARSIIDRTELLDH